MDLTGFLTARLNEDDAEALKLHDRLDGNVPLQHAFAARVLREVEAKRKILAAYRDADGQGGGMHWLGLRLAASHLAAVYDLHPDYDPAWKET